MISLTHIMKKLVTKNIHFGISPLTTAYKNQSTFSFQLPFLATSPFQQRDFWSF